MKAQIVEKNGKQVIYFPDAKFKEFLVAHFDKDGDGEISPEEAEGVQKMHCLDMEIESLAGIEYFTSLSELDCSYNKLESLDVSQNRELWYLTCKSNLFETFSVCKTNLWSLDIRDNPLLKTLECIESRLFTLLVDGCENLEELYCPDNRLRQLDVSDNPRLKVLACQANCLRWIDISNNIELEDLQANDNPLRHIGTNERRPRVFEVDGDLTILIKENTNGSDSAENA